MKSLVALLALLIAATPAAAQTREDEQLWANLTIFGTISDDLVYFFELQPRFGDGVSRVDQAIIRPAIGWRLSPKVTVYAGYLHADVPRVGGGNVNEERFFQQVSWIIARPAGGELASRTRLEQRWRSDGSDMGWRARQMVRLELPLDRAKGGLAALGYAEGFFALDDTDWDARAGFDQIRGFAGLEIPVGGKSTVELGYLNQTVNQTQGRTRMNHVASISLFLRH